MLGCSTWPWITARALEALARDQGSDRLAVLHAITRQAWVEHSFHNERSAISPLEPGLKDVADMPPSKEIVEAQAEMARALMMAGSYDESIELAERVLQSSELLSDRMVTDVVITKGTAMSNAIDRAVEGEILLRGAIQIAERSGDTWLALRARNNVLGAVSGEDALAAQQMTAEGYAIALRHGITTWSINSLT